MFTRRQFKGLARDVTPKADVATLEEANTRIRQLEQNLLDLQEAVDEFVRYLNAKGSIHLTHAKIDATPVGASVRDTGAFTNLAVGAALSAWGTVTPIQLANAAVFANNTDLYGCANARFDGANWKYQANGYACRYFQYSSGGGDHIFSVAASGTAGNTITWTQAFAVTADSNVVCGSAALATNAANGFLYAPTCAGTPTGTPTTFTGRAAVVVDTTNNKLYFYSGGAWRDAGP